ncbi:MAG: signal peptidase I [Bacilli bacterium]|nr:signal peptidase I [Bacilli bacterium]
MKKIGKIIKTIFNVAITVFVLLFLLIVCLQRFSNNQITFLGYRMFSVASSSMAPDYNIGDVLIVKKTEPDEIKVGDSISYYGKVGSFAGKVITHQVIKIDKDVDKNLVFHTKGISNLVEDPLVYADQIYGVVVHRSEVLSFIYRTVNTKYGMFIFIVIPIFYIIGSEMLAFLLEKEEERRGITHDDEEEEPKKKEK